MVDWAAKGMKLLGSFIWSASLCAEHRLKMRVVSKFCPRLHKAFLDRKLRGIPTDSRFHPPKVLVAGSTLKLLRALNTVHGDRYVLRYTGSIFHHEWTRVGNYCSSCIVVRAVRAPCEAVSENGNPRNTVTHVRSFPLRIQFLA